MIEPVNPGPTDRPDPLGLPDSDEATGATEAGADAAMAADIDEILEAVGSLDRIELEEWISARWVTPTGEPGEWQFTAIDLARIRLIREIHHDLGIDADAVPVVLSLLDQLHSTRRTLHALLDAIDRAPAEVRARIAPRLSSDDASKAPEA